MKSVILPATGAGPGLLPHHLALQVDFYNTRPVDDQRVATGQSLGAVGTAQPGLRPDDPALRIEVDDGTVTYLANECVAVGQSPRRDRAVYVG